MKKINYISMLLITLVAVNFNTARAQLVNPSDENTPRNGPVAPVEEAGGAPSNSWLTNPTGLHVNSYTKIGIGTSNPFRQMELNHMYDNFIRVTSNGGYEYSDHQAGIELRRTITGYASNWALVHQGQFKLKYNGTDIFRLSATGAWLGNSDDGPLSFSVHGKNVSEVGAGFLKEGALILHSKIGNTLHKLHIDGNQLESTATLHLNNLSDKDIVLGQGGGKVRIGNIAPEARLNVTSTSDMQLKLANPGSGGADWRIGVANSSWEAGAGKLVFSHTPSSQDATMVLTTAGKVGIGLTTPSKELHVNGTIRTNVLEITGGADLAEPFKIAGSVLIEPGTVVAIDSENAGQLRIAGKAYDKTVAGIISGAGEVNPGMIMGQQGTMADGDHPVALTGRVYVKADAGFGAIQPGDLLTTSDKPGYAMKVSDYQQAQGAIIGKAMTALEAGDGLVLVLVSLQ
jgi:hypothetical protein